MKLLILGGGGLIGQAIAKEHLRYGDEVFIYDNKSNKFNDYSNIVGEDLSHYSLKYLIKDFNFDVISHQAASVGVGESQYSIKKYVDNNIGFTAELLQYIVDYNKLPKQLILAGSMGPYGEGYYENLIQKGTLVKNRRDITNMYYTFCNNNEWDTKYPLSIYGVTKLAQEELFRVFAQTYDVDTISLRYFSVYGTEFNPNNPYTGVLSVIAAMIINSDKVSMFEDGEQTRDLIHCKDVAKAHYQATIVKMPPYDKFNEFNIGTGINHTLKEVAEQMISILEPNKILEFNGQYRKGDIKNSRANIDKAKGFLKWEPIIKLEDSIVEYCQFIKDNWVKFKIEDTNKKEKENLLKHNLIK